MSRLGKLKHPIRELYFSSSLKVARTLIHGRTGARRFDRVGVVGSMRSRNGISNGAALQINAIRSDGCKADLIDAFSAIGKPFKRIDHEPATAYVYHSGGPETSNLVLATLPHAASAYRIAYWAWELSIPPKRWPDVEGVYSEIWTPSEFSKQSLARRYRSVPIYVVPHRIPARMPRKRDRNQPFTVLAMGDSRSSFARKNIAGAVSAFKAAFGCSMDVRLIVKLTGKAGQAEGIPTEWKDLPNLSIVDTYISEQQLDDLYSRSDVFLSLHRAEGFGLPIMEAMARAIPGIATGWSGNLQFMNDTNSIMVPFKLVPVRDEFTYSIYGDAVWAEPDIDAAASALKRLHDDDDYYQSLAVAAHQSVESFAANWKLPHQGSMISVVDPKSENRVASALSLESV